MADQISTVSIARVSSVQIHRPPMSARGLGRVKTLLRHAAANNSFAIEAYEERRIQSGNR